MRIAVLTTIIFLLLGCKDIFTTSAFSSFKKDVSDMSTSELSAYISTTPLSDIPAADLAVAETVLEESRIELSDTDLANPALVQQYVEETTQLMDINMEQADVEGLISDALSIEDGGEDFVANLLDDTERLDNIEEASEYAVDAFLVDPDSLSSTELVVGGIGIISGALEGKDVEIGDIDLSDTAALEAAEFSTEEIADLQTAADMLTLAEAGLDDEMAGLFEGFSI